MTLHGEGRVDKDESCGQLEAGGLARDWFQSSSRIKTIVCVVETRR